MRSECRNGINPEETRKKAQENRRLRRLPEIEIAP